MAKTQNQKQLAQKGFVLHLVAFGVFANGLLLLLGILGRIEGLSILKRLPTTNARLSLTIIIGVSLIYLSSLLNRRKQAAWLISLVIYGFLLGLNISEILSNRLILNRGLEHLLNGVILPLIIVAGLSYYRREFNVRSDIRNFTLSLRFIAVALLIAFFYGVAGFLLLDKHDFHMEIGALQAMHYTIDQFNLTTGQAVIAYTDRGQLFLYSLSVVSATSLAYGAVSLFQPIRARFSDQSRGRQQTEQLLGRYNGSSEDFFKLWPHDKTYLLQAEVALAYHVQNGVALCVGDIAGNRKQAPALIEQFHELCRTNDWLPAFIHTEPGWNDFYKNQEYSLQKIGEEAILDVHKFTADTVKTKYFRQILNKFEKLDFKAELLLPPHNQAIISRLKTISADWLQKAGRAERGLMMGYFSEGYLQLCKLLVARDAAGTVQAFINQIPSFDSDEANFDMLRYAQGAPGNINDYLLIMFVQDLHKNHIARLNMGLSPLAGLADKTDESTVINNVLKYAYSYGDRFYSFSGLNRFKSKYEPNWHDRYIAYRGGARGFSRTLNALNKAMSKSPRHHNH